MKLHGYINEILDIAKANSAEFDAALNMFMANVRNAGEDGLPHYDGADQVDYAALKPHAEALAASAQACKAFFLAYREGIVADWKTCKRFSPNPKC